MLVTISANYSAPLVHLIPMSSPVPDPASDPVLIPPDSSSAPAAIAAPASDENFDFSRSLARPPILKEGSEGNAVSKLQSNLKAMGLLRGEVNGIYGPETTQAVMELQRRHQIPVDGIMGPETWAAIIPD